MKQEFYHGKVKQYNPEKGFGFIATAEGEIFFIFQIILQWTELKRNEKVKFLVQKIG
jgi:CspA family cold shock protein